ncbi:MAG: PAS domain S-box protein [candidate division NC10 bacterium]|nr:PAS domain S-box protein [candidate division NC10 bacterium]
MGQLLQGIFDSQGFEPHGYCFLWTRSLLWFYIVSDSLIALSYYSIPIALIYFVHKRRDLAFNWVFLFFAAFIIACGTTHLIAIWTLWSPLYWLDAAVKAITAGASVVTAVALWPLIPKALALPSPAQLEAANVALQGEIIERNRAQEALRTAYDEVETRVRERTRELARTTEALQVEIAERRQGEQRLRLQSAALESAANAIVITDREGNIIWVNPAFATLTGYTSEEVLDRNPSLLKSGKHDENFYRHLWETILAGQVWHGEIINRRKDGSLYIEDQTITPVRDKRGDITHFIAIKQDISERRRAEATRHALYQASLAIQEAIGLQERLNRLLQTAQTVLELDHVNIFLADPTEKILQSVASLEMEEPLAGVRVPIGSEGGGLAQAYRTQQAVIWDGHAPLPEPLRLKPPYDQIKSLRSQAFAFIPLVVQGRAIGVLGADWTQSRRPLDRATLELLQLFALQAAIAIERARLYEEQRMAAIQLEATVEERTRQLQEALRRVEAASRHKSEFLANMSHELRTPLNSILGFAELLRDPQFGTVPAKRDRYLDHIHQSGQHLLQLINDLLDLSKVEAGKLEIRPEAFPLTEAMTAAIEQFRTQVDAKELTLSLQLEQAPDILVADPLRFKQILYNLLSNAVKFTPTGGSITVMARPSERPDFVEIAVQDPGIGIKAEDLSRLFQEFTQLDNSLAKSHQGTGLGLALTKRLVELHGGAVTVTSPGEGQGSTFTVTLPGAAAPV